MNHFLDVLVSWGPLGILVLSVVESAGIPNPGGTDALLVLLTIFRPREVWMSVALAVCGSLGGSLVFLELTRKGGEKYLARYTSTGRGARFRDWFMRYGLLTVFIPALLPIPVLPLKVFVACAGAMGVSRIRFLLVLLAARIPRYTGLAFLGLELGMESGAWIKAHVWYLLAIAVALFTGLYGLIRYVDRKRVQ
jgi:membrane protein YqaA with SNARE-associated domain